MQFSYRGKDDRGGVQQGLLGAPNADAAATELMRRGITPLAIREVQETESVIDRLNRLPIFRKKVPLETISRVNFAAMLRAARFAYLKAFS